MYQELLSSANPGLIIIMIDQSGSMSDSYANSTKAKFASVAVNKVIEEIILSCSSGDGIKDLRGRQNIQNADWIREIALIP